MRRKEGNVEQISDLSGLASTNPVMATILTILMFSLAGIPPLAGFWGKWCCVPRRHQRTSLRAGDHRRSGLGGGRLLLPSHHQDHVVRRAGRRFCADGERTAPSARRQPAPSCCSMC
ncbi:proton-conducting transporter transmembrane domain-containing protein [Mesorhizobium atlanticum]